jgi:hypothetical protein
MHDGEDCRRGTDAKPEGHEYSQREDRRAPQRDQRIADILEERLHGAVKPLKTLLPIEGPGEGYNPLMTLLEFSRKARAVEERKNANSLVLVGVIFIALLGLTFLP